MASSGGRLGGAAGLKSPGGQIHGSRTIDTALYYIHCALSYQNQLLADIKSLLEQLTVEQTPSDGEK